MTSCHCWCRYVRNHLLSSDYEGCVTLWDVDTGMAVNEYEAHDKRIWSVDFCTADSSLFVSGSDDGWIKVGCRLILLPEANFCVAWPSIMALLHVQLVSNLNHQ